MSEFTFRKTSETDLDTLLKIYERARSFMAETGNPTQWSTNWPPKELIIEDITQSRNYVCELEGRIVGVFAYIQGINIDPTYERIDNGSWLSETEYGVIHRLASDGTVKGVALACIEFARSMCSHIRIDTHENNKVMQNIMDKAGFSKRGIIYVEKDNSPRIAYEII